MADTGLFSKIYNPDVLNCLANLSNDEVFTPPEVANQMLDLLPQELFRNPDTKFLDPACKSGVFLREIAKRLLVGLEPQIPDLQERIDHIFQNQLYGIAITELTSLLSRRSVYCSKYPNSDYSVSKFENAEGNIRFRRVQHTWTNGKCVHCGASQSEYDRSDELETYAYEFIHINNLKELLNVKFDVIISNPPYQLSDGGAQASAMPIYDQFVEQAKKLNPKYLSMIIPARWYSGGKGLDSFRNSMLKDTRISEIHDFYNASDCFPGVEIKGGVCYFLWDSQHSGDCNVYSHSGNTIVSSLKRPLLEKGVDTFIRYNQAISILEKVRKYKEKTFDNLVSTQKPFGFRTFVSGKKEPFVSSVVLYQNGGIGYVEKSEITRNIEWVDKYKIFISRAYGASDNFPHQILGKPIFGPPNSCCTETYVCIGPFETELEAQSAISYISTKFLGSLLLEKVSQMASSKVYELVPIQGFNKIFTDESLYEKYNITNDEIEFIESMIKPMDIEEA